MKLVELIAGTDPSQYPTEYDETAHETSGRDAQLMERDQDAA